MTTEYKKPLPEITPLAEPFWQGLKEHRLLLQRCDDCEAFRFIPKESCPNCSSLNAAWTEVAGTGTLYTYTVVHRAPSAAFQEDAPYVLAVVQLQEGPRMMSHLVDCSPDQVRIGMPVQVTFDDVTPEVTLYKFRRA